MAVTIASIQTNLNTYLGDASTDRVSAAERLQYITEAVIWLQEELKNDHQIKTYDMQYLDTVHYYRVTTPLADLLDGADLRRKVGENMHSFAHKSSRELAEEIAQAQTGDDSWTIERRDSATFIVINADPKYSATSLELFESSTNIDDWDADTTNSDATNVTFDQNRFNQGQGALNFDITVGQSGNNRATLENTSLSFDLSAFESTGIFLLDLDIPALDAITGATLYWGNSSTSYWSASVTTDLDGSALVAGWNTLGFEWSAATPTSSPDADESIDYFRFDLNYSGGQSSDTDFRLDNLRIANPEDLKFYYVSWDVGTNSGGTDLSAFTATTDIPYFSGQYDQYRYAVAHMAASIAFDNLRLKDEAAKEEDRAFKALKRAREIFPSSITKESKSFKVHGVNLNK